MRGFPNGATRHIEDMSYLMGRRTQGTETSKYLQEKKTTVIPPVAASDRGTAQTDLVSARSG